MTMIKQKGQVVASINNISNNIIKVIIKVIFIMKL